MNEHSRELHGLLLVDKPEGLTSAAVVASVKRTLRQRKVGHLGTLDPGSYVLHINGYSYGRSQYGGNTTTTLVPEPASWSMMVAGFGLIGGALRSRKRAACRFA